MVTIKIGNHSSAQGVPEWVKGNIACIRINGRLLKGELVSPR
jgi:hypothetical protein